MKYFRSFIFVSLIVIVVLLVVGLVFPSDYTVERERLIKAPPSTIHQYVNDLTQWDAWTPWQDSDSTLETSFGEKTEGVGAVQSWTGQDGGGKLEITASSLDAGVEYMLEFGGVDTVTEGTIEYTPVEGGTLVKWTMRGSLPFPVVGAYIAMMMDSMAGKDFERGLAQLGELAEGTE